MRLMMIRALAAIACVTTSAAAQQPAAPPPTTTKPKPPSAAPQKPIDPRVAAFNKSLGELRQLFKQRKFTDAIASGKELIEQARAIYGERHPRYTGSLYNLGLFYNGAKQYENAARLFKQAFLAQHPLRSPADKSYKRVLSSLASINKQLGRARETGRYYTMALEKLNRNGRINSAAAVYYYTKAGELMRYLADFDNAEKLLRHALATKRKISKPDDHGQVWQLNGLAGLLRARGKFSEAEPLYIEAIRLQIKTKGEWNASTGILLDNIAVMYLHMGEPERAEPYQKRALAILEKTLGPENRSTGITLANLAELYRSLRRFQESETLFERAVAVLTKRFPANHPRLGVVYDNLAGLYRQQKKNRKAHQTYLKAIKLLKAAHGADHPEVGIALNNIGIVLINMGRLQEAENRFLESLAISRKAHGDNHISLATSLGNLADVRITMGKLDEAKADAERAIKLITQTLGPQHHRLIFPMTRAGYVERRNGNLAKAFDHYATASKLYELARQRGGSAQASIEDSGAINDLVATAYTIARDEPTNPGSPVQRAAFRFSQLKTLTSAGDALNKLGARLGASDPKLRKLARERQDVAAAWSRADKALLAAVSADPKRRNAENEAALRARILDHQTRLTSLDEQLSTSYPQFTALNRPRPITVVDVQALLARDEVLLQYLVAKNHTYAWAIAKSSVKFTRIDLKRNALRDNVQALRCGLDEAEWIGETKPLRCLKLIGRMAEEGQLPFAAKPAHTLYQKLLQPFEEITQGRKLLIVGSDALSRLPMHILLTAPLSDDRLQSLRDAPWLVRRHAITVLPSVSSFVILRRDRRTAADAVRQPYLAIANPLLTGADGTNRTAYAVNGCPPPETKPPKQHVAALIGTLTSYFRGGQADPARLRLLEPLPETAIEVCAVARDLGASLDNVLLGSAAIEPALRKINAADNGLERYRILHFATHGLVSGELRGLAEPALVLTPPETKTPDDDGLLTASEVAELKLNAEWVILSACNTAAGAGYGADALSGLARAFFYAGARSLLVSHWPVRSDAAVALTTRAIRQLTLKKSLGRSVAMQRAMLSVIADTDIPGGAHPQVWAPFVVVGEGAASR